MPSLIIDVRPGERLALSERDGQPSRPVTVELLRKSGQLVRLRVTAPPDVRIERQRNDAAADPSMTG